MRQDPAITAVTSLSSGIKSKKISFRSDFLTVVHDLAPVWDFVIVSTAGYSTALVYDLLSPLHHDAPIFTQDVGRIALFGGLMAAVVMRGSRTTLASDVSNYSLISSITGAARRVLVLACLLLAIGFLTRILDAVPRLWVLAWAASSLAVAVGGRIAFMAALQMAVRRGVFKDRVAIIGSGHSANLLARHIAESRRGQGVELVGVFADPDEDPWANGLSLDKLFSLGQAGLVDRVILALPSSRESRVIEIVERLKALDIEASFFPALPGLDDMNARFGRVAGATLIVLSPRPIRQWGLIAKAALDGVVACVGLALLSPLLIAIVVAIRLDSEGPIIFRQKRHGRNNSEFMIYKFRTMTHVATGSGSALQQTARGDHRFTKIGRLLRKTSLDELPQLFNVLNGTMSLVGPRPHAVVMRTEDMLGEEIIPEYAQRHRIKPGITGWAQIKGHRGATETADQVRERVRHDIYYVENWSFLLDLRILSITPFSILFSRNNAY